MPGSFGRVESHCFGCERAFEGEKPQGVAEEVFTRLIKEQPDKPQVHYLMGYLRAEQKRFPEAAASYRQAVQLDPLYLNAWNKLAELQEEIKFSPTERDDLLLKLVELDPGRRHVSPNLVQVADIPRMWRAVQAAGQKLDELPATKNLWELKASARQADLHKDQFDWAPSGFEKKDAASVLLEHPFVGEFQSYLVALEAKPE
jgi:tetratricopeptide (TPR) repeat protein